MHREKLEAFCCLSKMHGNAGSKKLEDFDAAQKWHFNGKQQTQFSNAVILDDNLSSLYYTSKYLSISLSLSFIIFLSH